MSVATAESRLANNIHRHVILQSPTHNAGRAAPHRLRYAYPFTPTTMLPSFARLEYALYFASAAALLLLII